MMCWPKLPTVYHPYLVEENVKLLLDEQIDVRLKGELSEIEVYTLLDLGWQGLKTAY
jgi:hypothetical protein